MQQKIIFKQERDFGTVLGDSLKFFKQNFKSLYASILAIVGPFILLMGLSYGYMQTGLMSFRQNALGGLKNFNMDFFASIGGVVIFGIFTATLLNSVVFSFMELYNQKLNDEKITVSEVGQLVWKNIGKMVASTITFVFFFLLLLTIIVLIGIGLGSMLGVVVSVLLGFAAFFGLIIFLPVFYYIYPASFYVVIRDEVFIFKAIGKVLKYLKENFWWTWLIMVVTIISISILNFVFNLPATIISLVDTFSRVKELSQGASAHSNSFLLTFFYVIGMFLTTCAGAVVHIIAAFNFLSLEEKHEGNGLLERIEEIK